MNNFFKLIRFQNLFIIAITQYMFRYFILIPLMSQETHTMSMLGTVNFALLVISTMMVAAAGYAINDYFDVKADKINKPKKMLIGRGISRRQVMLYHTVLSGFAILIGLYLSFRVGSLKLGLVNILASIFLWFYTTSYKKYFLVGNIVVALFSGLVVVVPWWFESAALLHHGIILNDRCYRDIHILVFVYFIFATLTSLIREIIKDIEDIEGDKSVGCHTMPIVLGIRKTQKIVSLLSVVTVIGLGYVCTYLFRDPSQFRLFLYLVLAVCLPFIYMAYLSFIAKTKSDFTLLSNVAKYCLVAGVFSMFIIFLI